MSRRALNVGASHTRLLWQRSVRGTIESRAERRVEERFRGSRRRGGGCLGARFGQLAENKHNANGKADPMQRIQRYTGRRDAEDPQDFTTSGSLRA